MSIIRWTVWDGINCEERGGRHRTGQHRIVERSKEIIIIMISILI